MPKIYNKYHGDAPADVVNCTRPGPWGNKYSHLGDKDETWRNNTVDLVFVETRDEACQRFDEDTMKDPEFQQRIKEELRGKDLLCCCVPKRCHCETLLRIANE